MLRAVLLLVLAALPFAPAVGQSPSGWAQEVHYEMDITLHADAHRYTGHQVLTYANHAPDTLRTVYYHLYFNAFHPESMMAERNRQLPDPDGRVVPRVFHLTPDEQGRHRIQSLTQDGQSVSYDIHDTVMRVDLATPIPPGDSSTFELDWTAQVPLQTRRSGRDSRGDSIDYTMTQWYPKMAEYDERGWHANYYVNREYYAPFGSFDVELTLPAEYTVGATGVLQNPNEVGHGYDIEGNGTWRPPDGTPNQDSLTWHFTAENVHNFAWSADPDYVHDKVTADGTTHHILYKPEVAEQWEPLTSDMPKLTAFFSREYGEYPYPQMTVAQGGDGGMEYPMFTVVSSYNRPDFDTKRGRLSVLGTTVHEFAHMWYYAALGSNEADYAWIDEGFTSYATSEGMAHLTGGSASHSPAVIARFQKLGLFESLNTPADWFETNIGYGVASYPGGEMVVDMLGYVIGDETRDQWFKRLFRERKFQHPDPFDLELFAEQESGLMLDWYFHQFTGSTRTLDDAITDLDQTPTDTGYEATLTLERKGEAALPHDLKLTLADGSTQWVNVPLASMHGHKPVPDDWIVTSPWPWVQPGKTITIEVPTPVETATLDPNERTPDLNRLNNSTDFPLKTRFLHAPESNWSQYELGIRPLAGYANHFGPGGGVQARGQYFLGDRTARATLTLWPRVLASNGDAPTLGSSFQSLDDGDWFSGLDYELRYQHTFPPFGPRSTIEAQAAKHLGVLENALSVHVPLRSPRTDVEETLDLSLVHQYARSDRAFGLPATRITCFDTTTGGACFSPLVVPWTRSHVLSTRLHYEIADGADRVSLTTDVGSALADNFRSSQPPRRSPPPLRATRVSLRAQHATSLGPLTGTAALHTGLGANDLVDFKQFVLGGRAFEQQWRADAYRQAAGIFESPTQDAHLVGFGPSGPVAYLRAKSFGLTGENVLSGRLSIGGTPFPTLNPLSPLDLSLFSGVGTVWNEGAFFAGLDSDKVVGDAGFGARYRVSSIPHLDRWTAQSDVLSNLDVVAKFPIWASDPQLLPNGNDEFAFRWLIGIEL